MSTINEALKKVEKKREPVTTTRPFYQESAPQPQINVTHITQQHKVSYPLIATLVVVVFIAGIFITRWTMGSSQAPVVIRSSQSVPEQTAQADTEPVEKTQAPSFAPSTFPMMRNMMGELNFKLSGIIFSEDDPSAIINNEIVKQGDTINGAIVQCIEKDCVKLSYQGKELTVRVK